MPVEETKSASDIASRDDVTDDFVSGSGAASTWLHKASSDAYRVAAGGGGARTMRESRRGLPSTSAAAGEQVTFFHSCRIFLRF